MEVLRSYVVRVYRQESDGVAGVIESVETGEVAPFRSSDELWDVLSHPLSARGSQPSNITDPQDGK
ncbi:MAG TPA: hypothetical protein VMH26_04785 [Burkholderiales bacterium]|nr:hypothetical protein [Burkholderiales bacterium]